MENRLPQSSESPAMAEIDEHRLYRKVVYRALPGRDVPFGGIYAPIRGCFINLS
jgi:hypothetical protein